MRVFRGRAGTIDADRAMSERLLEIATAGEPAVRVWIPHRQVAFGRRDARLPGYRHARVAAREAGFPPIERDVGGRAVAYDGATTIAFARGEPIEGVREGTDERYERLAADVEAALAELGLEVSRGEPADAFCPGSHSLQADGGKVAGIAQRVRRNGALVAGLVLVDAADELAGALGTVYDALEVPFDPNSVGSVADAGGPTDPELVRATLEETLVGDRSVDKGFVGDPPNSTMNESTPDGGSR